MIRRSLALLALVVLTPPAAAADSSALDAAMIVIQGTVDAVNDDSLTIGGVAEVTLIDGRTPGKVAKLELTAFDQRLWGKGGPFAAAAPQAAITAAAIDTMTLISVEAARVVGGKLVLTFGLDLGELPDQGEAILLSLAGPVDAGGEQGSSSEAAPTGGAKTGGQSVPLGIRAHNPLDIRPLDLPEKWDGQIGLFHTSDAAFVIFEDFPYGLRAAAHLIRNYQRNYGIRSLLGKKGYRGEDGIISRWSPPSDHNDTKVYVTRVSELTGFAPTQELDLEDGETVAKILEAMTRVELGIADDGDLPYTDADMKHALELAEFE